MATGSKYIRAKFPPWANYTKLQAGLGRSRDSSYPTCLSYFVSVGLPLKPSRREFFMAHSIASAAPSYAARGPAVEPEAKNEAYGSGVSWAAVIAGASVTAALFLTLLALGAGVGLSAISPWSSMGASASRIGAGAI